MRVLLASTAGAGHLGPLVPFAHALRRAGHEILVAAPISAQPRVERAGLPSISVRRPAGARSRAGLGARPAQRPPTRPTGSSWASCSGASARAPRCPASSWRSTRWRPDVVVRESCEFASAVAAEARDIPVARVGAFLLHGRGVRDPRRRRPASTSCAGGRPRRPTRTASGCAASPYLTLTPGSFELPDGPSRRTRVRFHAARAAAAGGAGRGHAAARLPDLRLGRGRPRLLPGPLPRGHRRARRPADPAAGDGRRGRRPGRARPLPAHVRAERWIPQAEVFPEADAMVGHGGFGTTMGALRPASRRSCVPLFADQPYNAARVAASAPGSGRPTPRACAPPSSGCSPRRVPSRARAGSRSRPRACRRSARPATLEALARGERTSRRLVGVGRRSAVSTKSPSALRARCAMRSRSPARFAPAFLPRPPLAFATATRLEP